MIISIFRLLDEEQLNTGRLEISSLSNPEYFEKIFKEYFKPLSYYAVKLVRDQDSAKEIVHTVFISLWDKRDTISLDQPIRSYLYTAVHNRCLNFLRDRSKFIGEDAGDLEFLSGLAAPEESQIEHSETESRINDAINRLPEKCRRIFKMNRFEEKKYSEIADELNISVKTVEGQISKALRILRDELKDYLILLLWFIVKIFLP
jgi:RNA polymerase sigma-70 factor (ECF subfamily)